MAIDLLWVDASGARRDEVGDPSSMVSEAIQRVREDRGRRDLLISRIDPYGDTLFSSTQAAQLAREFKALRNASADVEERIALGHMLSVLRAADGAVGEWLEFAGD